MTVLTRTGRYQIGDVVKANIRLNGEGLWRPAVIVHIVDDDRIRVAGLTRTPNFRDGSPRRKFDGYRCGLKNDGYIFGGRLVMLNISSGDIAERIGSVYPQMALDIIAATAPSSLSAEITAAFLDWNA